MTTVILEKDLWSQWEWQYSNDKTGYAIREVCYTNNRDTEFTINGELVARTDTKTLSMYSETIVRDCHGKPLYVMKTDDLFETIDNNNKVVNINIYDESGKNQLGSFMRTTGELTDTIIIHSLGYITIVHMERNRLSPTSPWKWTSTILEPNFRLSDPRLYLLLEGMASFASDDNRSGGGCNTYFSYTTVAVIIFTIIMFFYVIVLCFSCYKPKVGPIESIEMV